MNITEVLPTVVVVTDSKEFFTNYQKQVQTELPDLICMWVSAADARKSFSDFDERSYRKNGFDIWIPRASCVNLGRSFRRKIRHLVR